MGRDRTRRWPSLVLVFIGGALALSISRPAPGQRPRPRRAPIPDDAPPLPVNETACNYQGPIPVLVRENFLPRWTQPAEEQRRRRGLQAEAVRFRTENYGHFEGFGRAAWNDNPPIHYAERTEFMGLRVRLNQKILPALACVEEQIRVECAEDNYEPVRLSGIRTRNTYHNSQVSNHVYGIAIDIDPQLNTCCMCVAQWGDHPLCQREVESIYERMSMPPCWVHVFERFGFYWLGRDRLQDTMHFEFLGDPDHILKTSGAVPHMQAAEGEANADGEAEGEAEGSSESEGEAEGEGAGSESAASPDPTRAASAEGAAPAGEEANATPPNGSPASAGAEERSEPAAESEEPRASREPRGMFGCSVSAGVGA
ncbi:MAG: M15 family metallopeptidase [Myxococcota bacterium]